MASNLFSFFFPQYVRMSTIDTKSEAVLKLLQKQWGLDLPNLIITMHGGMANFDLSPKMKRSFRKGLVKFAKTTGAWVFTSGVKTGEFAATEYYL